MLRLLRQAMDFFRRRTDPTQEQQPQQAEFPKGNSHLKNVQGVVTSFYGDYGLISGSIYFSCHVVTNQVPVKVGQKVRVVLEEVAASHGFKAIKVDALCDDIDDPGSSEPKTRVLTACVTSVSTDAVYISKKTYFSLDIVSEDFMPYNGDWLAIEYSILPGTYNIKAHSVKPIERRHVEEVCITSRLGRNGVIDNNIFFTLDSLDLPDGYSPQVDDLVNVVMVESVQLCYLWRAISLIPVKLL
ncbi:cancer/testis antigen 55 [Tupaia chinensis]|uniref:cancer/testis antigen 55 n=1 Tax=Tupaia chinensis TaxID=246437 RepID=UPI000703CB7B|nr:cancer/testis antigen 55 [Tupaia chinensis]